MVREAFLKQLEQDGWKILDPKWHTAVAQCTFATAVGPKVAHVYLSEGHDDFSFQAEYYSEGRNILESCTVVVPSDIDSSALSKALSGFTESIRQKVRSSYAVMLLAGQGVKR